MVCVLRCPAENHILVALRNLLFTALLSAELAPALYEISHIFFLKSPTVPKIDTIEPQFRILLVDVCLNGASGDPEIICNLLDTQ